MLQCQGVLTAELGCRCHNLPPQFHKQSSHKCQPNTASAHESLMRTAFLDSKSFTDKAPPMYSPTKGMASSACMCQGGQGAEQASTCQSEPLHDIQHNTQRTACAEHSPFIACMCGLSEKYRFCSAAASLRLLLTVSERANIGKIQARRAHPSTWVKGSVEGVSTAAATVAPTTT